MSDRIMVVLSGGLDSSVLLGVEVANGRNPRAVTIDYGQRHAREIAAARAVAAHYGVPHVVVDLRGLATALPGSSQTDASVPVPEGHYEDATMRATVVPNRNMILLAVAAGHALAHGCDTVAYAAHAGDHAVYPDCRPKFVIALAQALKLCDYEPFKLLAPFLRHSKAQIAAMGAAYNVPMHLTWSCYVGGDRHCGKCGTCVERREAFALAGIEDPTDYEVA